MTHKMKNAALVLVGILAGIAISGPAATAGLMANLSSQQFYVNDQRVNLQAYWLYKVGTTRL